MLQDLENKILHCMIGYLTENKIYKESMVLIFDGLMLYKNDAANLDIHDL